jgi:hypothetical protein
VHCSARWGSQNKMRPAERLHITHAAAQLFSCSGFCGAA